MPPTTRRGRRMAQMQTQRQVGKQPQKQAQSKVQELAQEQSQHQATASTSTAVTTVVSQQQSVQLMQMYTLGAMSNILSIRNLFHENDFTERQYDINTKKPWTYKQWAEGKTAAISGQKTQVLKRGSQNEKADKFLTWLEVGAFDALEKGHLNALQLRIFQNHENPQNILEMYTFKFNYASIPGSDRKALTGSEITGPGGTRKQATLKNITIALSGFIQDLIRLCGTIPDLPEKSRFTLHVFYTDDCPRDYSAEGFEVQDSTDPLMFASGHGWARVTHELQGSTGSYHDMSLRVSHLQAAVEDDQAGSIPSDLLFTDKISLADETAQRMDIEPEHQESSSSKQQGNGGSMQQGMNGLTGANTQLSRVHNDASHLPDAYVHALNTENSTQFFQPENSANEPRNGSTTLSRGHLDEPDNPFMQRPSEDPPPAPRKKPARNRKPEYSSILTRIGGADPAHEALPGNQRTSSGTLAGSDTLNGSRNSQLDAHAASQVNSHNRKRTAMNTQDRDERQALEKYRKISDPVSQDTQLMEESGVAQKTKSSGRQDLIRPRLQAQKLEELRNKKKMSFTRASTSAGTREPAVSPMGMQSKAVIACQCGSNKEEDDNMIHCEWCGTWQHAHCYGFHGTSDPRIPHLHTCYNCLLRDTEPDILRTLQHVSLSRRCIHVMQQSGFRDIGSFAEAVGTDRHTTVRALNELRKRNMVNKTEKAPYSQVDDKDERSKMIDEYFSPYREIEHHYTSISSKPDVAPAVREVLQETSGSFNPELAGPSGGSPVLQNASDASRPTQISKSASQYPRANKEQIPRTPRSSTTSYTPGVYVSAASVRYVSPSSVEHEDEDVDES